MLFSTTSLSSGSKERAVAKALALLFSGRYRPRGRMGFFEIAKRALNYGYRAFSVTGRESVFFTIDRVNNRWHVVKRLRTSFDPPDVPLRRLYRYPPLSAPRVPAPFHFLCRPLFPTYCVELVGEVLKGPMLSLKVRKIEAINEWVGVL